MGLHLRRLLAILDRPALVRLPVLFAVSAAVTIADVVGIGLVFPLAMVFVDPGAVERVDWLARLASWFGAGDAGALVQALGLAVCGLFLLKNALSVLLLRWLHGFVSEAEARVGTRLLDRYLSSPWQAVSQRNSSELIRNASVSVSHTFLSVLVPGTTLMVEGMLSVAVLCVLLLVDPLVSLSAAAVVAAASAAYLAAARKALARTGAEFQEAQFGLLNHLKQGIHAGREIRVLGRKDLFLDRLASVRLTYARAQARRAILVLLPRYYLESVLVLAVLAGVGVALGSRPASEVAPVIAVFGVAALRLTTSASRCLAALQQVRIGLPALEAVHADLVGGPVRGVEERGCSWPAAAAERGVVLDRVQFSYREGRPALCDVSLALAWGEHVGIVGQSGSGKSTLIDVLLGLLPPERGAVRVDGADIRTVLAAWRSRIGYVPQHVYLTDDTLRSNIAFGVPEAEIDEEAVRAAVRSARLEETVAALPAGLDTPVGEHGTALSGGQRQRIGIARALYHDPDVLILDEATSALDNETERSVMDVVHGLRGVKTAVVVTHRLATVRRCDRVVLIESGRVQAVGTFDDLARDSEGFARMVSLGQLGQDSPDTANPPGHAERADAS
jgi:ABC-type multidrug transport system fused ATPase/permease subunit